MQVTVLLYSTILLVLPLMVGYCPAYLTSVLFHALHRHVEVAAINTYIVNTGSLHLAACSSLLGSPTHPYCIPHPPAPQSSAPLQLPLQLLIWMEGSLHHQ
jgi:hypothetical protein